MRRSFPLSDTRERFPVLTLLGCICYVLVVKISTCFMNRDKLLPGGITIPYLVPGKVFMTSGKLNGRIWETYLFFFFRWAADHSAMDSQIRGWTPRLQERLSYQWHDLLRSTKHFRSYKSRRSQRPPTFWKTHFKNKPSHVLLKKCLENKKQLRKM